jgi:hypothetical protein
MRRVLPRVAAAALILVTAACGGGDGGGKPQAQESRLVDRVAGPATITVDFAAPTAGQHALTGLLLGIGATDPPDSVVKPVQPQLVRAWPDVTPYSRAVELGVPYVELVGDEWGYPFQEWKGKGPPWADFAAWESFVQNLASTWRGRDVIFDIWNEPNSPLTWQGTFQQYVDTFVRAARVIRSELGEEARIAGPETNLYDPYFMGGFMDAMKAANVRVDVLSWHELPDPQEMPELEANANDARTRWVDNPAYASVGVKQLGVYETITQVSVYAPGDALATFYYLEKGRVDAAARACWPQENGLSSCTDGTMGKLVTPNDFQPRSVWWAYKLYADGVASRVASSTTDPLSVALASAGNASASAQVLVARIDRPDSSAKVSVPIDLKGLAQAAGLGSATSVKVAVSVMPTTGAEPLDDPVAAGERTVPITGGVASIQVDIAAHEGVLLTLTAA